MPRTRSAAVVSCLAIAVAVLSGCSSTVAVQAAPDAGDPRCAEVMVRLPEAFGDEQRRWTDAQSTAAWGDPTTVQFTCGVTPLGPTELACQTVGGVDWVIDESRAPLYRLTTYGRIPAVEVVIDSEALSSSGPIDALSRLIAPRFAQDRACVAASEVTP